MPADLESQLRASLPGRETAVQDYARAWAARGNIKHVIDVLRGHRAEIVIAIAAQAPLHERLSEAILLLSQVQSDLERVHLPRLMLACSPAGRVPR